jgi:two-component system phosphate regulon sensor histidine kinase PhoR
VRLEVEEAPAGGRVLGDESWLHRAVTNLINNALKYTPPGGQVRVRYREAEGQAICEVTDTGPGIPSTAQPRLFERFYRVPGEPTRRNPGTGLGLAIVKAIVERHSGRVWVSSEEGKGSTFGFSVPLAPGDGPEAG